MMRFCTTQHDVPRLRRSRISPNTNPTLPHWADPPFCASGAGFWLLGSSEIPALLFDCICSCPDRWSIQRSSAGGAQPRISPIAEALGRRTRNMVYYFEPPTGAAPRSEERRVGKEGRAREAPV